MKQRFTPNDLPVARMIRAARAGPRQFAVHRSRHASQQSRELRNHWIRHGRLGKSQPNDLERNHLQRSLLRRPRGQTSSTRNRKPVRHRRAQRSRKEALVRPDPRALGLVSPDRSGHEGRALSGSSRHGTG